MSDQDPTIIDPKQPRAGQNEATPLSRHFVSLRIKLAMPVFFLALVFGIIGFVIVPQKLDETAFKGIRQRVISITDEAAWSFREIILHAPENLLVIEGQRTQGPQSDMDRDLQRLVSRHAGDYALIRLADGTVLASYNPLGLPNPPAQVSGVRNVKRAEGYLHAVAPFKADLAAENGEAARPLPNLSENQKRWLGAQLELGFSLDSYEDIVRAHRLITGIFALISALCLAYAAYALSALVVHPLNSLMNVMHQIVSTGDLGIPILIRSNDEAGLLADNFRDMVTKLQSMFGALHRQSDSISAAIQQLSSVGTTVTFSTDTVRSLVGDSSSSIKRLQRSLSEVEQNVSTLRVSAESSATTTIEIAATNDQVANNANIMADATGDTASAVNTMASNIQDIARKLEDLTGTLSETSAAMYEVETAITQVESNASETAKISEQVAENAKNGVSALDKTMLGIGKIKEASQSAAEVIGGLESSVFSIGQILGVIDEVANRTNLLALNAAIIAAQAGEHGRGFGVVADEIKGLAERTRSSTSEIASLIEAVQERSTSAVHAMQRGMSSVEDGVKLGRAAHDALTKIDRSSADATAMVHAIARATVEQSHGTRHVSQAISRIASTLDEIKNTSTSQARGSDQIVRATQTMNELIHQLQRSADEQAKGSRGVIHAIEGISDMAGRLNDLQMLQIEACQGSVRAISEIADVSSQQSAAVINLDSAIKILQQQSEELRNELQQGSFLT